MKKLFFKIFIISTVLFYGCEEILNVENLEAFNPDDTWNDETLTEAYLTDLYGTISMKWTYNRVSDDGISNEGKSADESIGLLTEGYVQTTNAKFKQWIFSRIRKINILLTEIDNGNLSENFKNEIKGQAYFLRAYEYFNMVLFHGGVPILTEPQSLSDDLYIPRNSTKECFDFIIDDLNKAINLLPEQYTGDDYGRIDKAATLAYKGRVLLFKASPQFNPSNPFDNDYWQEAYNATKTAKEQLEALGYGLVDNYDDIFLTEQHKEAVLAVVYTNPGKTNSREKGVRPLSFSGNASGYDQPTWEFVESYPMIDGKQAGESIKYPYDIQTYWQNRDPRFEATIIYNGGLCPLEGVEERRVYMDGIVGNPADAMASTTLSYCHTGFYCRKGLDLSLLSSEVDLNSLDWLEIRFAEVLMNYAEAANEMNYQDEAITILKTIRERAGIEAGDDGMYGITASTKEEIREAIHFENKIEFAFEGNKRFWELRRMRMFSYLDGQQKNGLQPILKEGLDPYADVTYLPEDFDYVIHEPFALGSQKVMVVPDSYYFFPIPDSEIEKNPNLEQNIGWEGGTFNPTLE